jgi:hypothetical protein
MRILTNNWVYWMLVATCWTLWLLTLVLAVCVLTGCQSPPPKPGVVDPRIYLPSGQIIDPRTVGQPGLVLYQGKF